MRGGVVFAKIWRYFMTFEFEVDCGKFCSGEYTLAFSEKFWPELKNEYADKDLVLAKRATLTVDDKIYTLSSINEDIFFEQLEGILLEYCDAKKPTGQKTVYIDFKYVIPLQIKLNPKTTIKKISHKAGGN